MRRPFFRFYLLVVAAASLMGSVMPAGAQDSLNLGATQAIPPVPTNLIASQKYSLTNVQLDWNNVGGPAVSEFHVFRLENYSPDTTLKTVAVVPRPADKIIEYYDKTIIPGHTYTYFVTSKDRFGTQSANSKLVTITTKVLPPSKGR